MKTLKSLFTNKTGDIRMNKSIAELEGIKIINMPVEVVDLTVKAKKNSNGWDVISPYKFKSKNIIVNRIVKSSDNFYMYYYDTVANNQQSVVVPPDFMFKLLDNKDAKELIEKFHAYQLKYLEGSCGFSGKIGSDPEIFVEDGKGKIIPAFDFLGSKENPNKCPGYGESYNLHNPDNDDRGNTIYWDGFQAEFTTLATNCMGWHGDSLQAGLRGLYELVKKHDKKAKLSHKTVFDISKRLLKSAAPEHVAFGCNPSLNAYGMSGLEMPGTAVEYRSAGGHVHLGFNDNKSLTKDDYINMVKGLDAIMGVAGVSLFAKYDDPRRRMMYGLAGEYRLPPHGLEYRTLSNAWLFHPVLANIVFDLSRTAAMFGKNKMLVHWNATEAETIEVINTCNVEGARAILKRNEALLLRLLNVKLQSQEASKYALKAILEGADSIIKNMKDIEGNWGLTKKWRTHCDGKNKNVHFTINDRGTGLTEKI